MIKMDIKEKKIGEPELDLFDVELVQILCVCRQGNEPSVSVEFWESQVAEKVLLTQEDL
jgi:hypothetical protein